MTMPPADVRSLCQAGVEALRRGDPAAARGLFQRAAAAAPADLTAWLGLAYACHGLKDAAARLAALDRVLEIDPRNLRALALKGDHFAEAGDGRAAAAFYGAAVRLAPPADRLPPDLQAELRRAEAMAARYAADFEGYLRGQMQARGFAPGRSSGRFERGLDILFGRRQVYHQEPQVFLFPELPQIQFYEREAFPWLDALEAATAEIRAELLAVLEEDGAFSPYVEGAPDRPQVDAYGLRGNPDWSAFFLVRDGTEVAANAARCPRTMEALRDVPLSRIRGRTPSILFSQLRPGARIPPHTGFLNTRLICHLPLIVPEGCGFRVGNDTRFWQEGRAWVFDDTIQHEAWNGSDRTRVILLFDIWRPELTEEEQRLVAGMLEAIDDYGGERRDWSL
ncbi:MAG TPA: aspartyl/asparaginyl beta-hydroxylase domain-containing protein [Azospirillaceae bacterium]|nr:aspartyl/asparaginyl beta-hydroxylase domain-containing protein [Azospirillaceae bacterium]